jgi:transcriptional regulator with XRE-family HTH domain
MTATKAITAQEQALETLGTFLRREREAFGLSQLAVAAHAGVSQPLYSGLETGHRALMTHRVSEFGDSAVLGAIKYLLTQLKEARYELVRGGDARMCAASISTLNALVQRSALVCMTLTSALEDGELDSNELEEIDSKLEQLEESVRQTRRDVAVRQALLKRERQAITGLAKCQTGSVAQAKVAR